MKRAVLVPKEETVPICPVKNAPICPEGRARTLPGFHLISIDAAVEAMEKGSYHAHGADHPITDFEVLHPLDKLHICDIDNKLFLNKSSLLYH
eukprot:g17121.t1